jgi:hypothetical protein
LKSFALFTAFVYIPYIKIHLGEYESYIMDSYIANKWMQNKEKLILYNRLTTQILTNALRVQSTMKNRP